MAIIPNGASQEINIETQQQKKTKNLVYLLILIIVVAAAIWYFGTKSPSSPTGLPPGDMSQISQDNKLLDDLRKTSLENTVFKDKRFEALMQNGDFPISIGQRGRENPFAPY